VIFRPGDRLKLALRLDLAAAGLNPFLKAVAAGLTVLYLMLYIGIAASGPKLTPSAAGASPTGLAPTASSYPAPPDFVR
jgi:hypothetical protein